jgi:hypothetical protein
VQPQKPDGYLEIGSGHLVDIVRTGRADWNVIRNTPEEICIELWAATGACETEVSISGRPAATERYYQGASVVGATSNGVEATSVPAFPETTTSLHITETENPEQESIK